MTRGLYFLLCKKRGDFEFRNSEPRGSSDCLTGQANCTAEQDPAVLDTQRLAGLLFDDAPRIFGSKLAGELDKLTFEELVPVELVPDQILGAKYELIPVFTHLRSTDEVVPVFNTVILDRGMRVAIAKPVDLEGSRALFAKLPYTRDQLVGAAKNAFGDFTAMTGLPVTLQDATDDADVVIALSHDFFERLGKDVRFAPGYSDVDEGGFEVRTHPAIGKYLKAKGKLVILNPMRPEDYFSDTNMARLSVYPPEVATALFLHQMRVVALQEITHSTCYAGGFNRVGLGHTSTITSVMYSGADGATDLDVRTKGASESLGTNETQLLVKDGRQYVVRSRLAPPSEDVAGLIVRALRAIVKKFGLAS